MNWGTAVLGSQFPIILKAVSQSRFIRFNRLRYLPDFYDLVIAPFSGSPLTPRPASCLRVARSRLSINQPAFVADLLKKCPKIIGF